MELIFRKAKEGDIPNIVKMLADDELGSKREDYKVPLPKSYYDAFQNSWAAVQISRPLSPLAHLANGAKRR